MKIIEFMGMPKAGKTTQIEIVEKVLRDEKKLKVRAIHEGARICPLDKEDRFHYNAWSFHNTANRILEARLCKYDYLLIDRGVYDHIAFTQALFDSGHITRSQYVAQTSYFHEFGALEDAVMMFKVSPEESMKRENKHQERRGRVMNSRFLMMLNSAYLKTAGLIQPSHIVIDNTQTIEESTKQIMEFLL